MIKLYTKEIKKTRAIMHFLTVRSKSFIERRFVMITKREIEYDGYGRCLEISNGKVVAVVTLDFGPRIIRYSFVDGENIMFEDKDRVFFECGEQFDEAFGKGSTWYIYGGHRLWTSPEGYPGSYYPDNDPVAYTLTERGALFTSDIQRWNQYQYEIGVEMSDDTTDVTVTMKVTNRAAWPVTLAPWGISVLSAGGTLVVPQPIKNTGVLANRQIALWSYNRMTDKRFLWLDKYMILRQDASAGDVPFKFGINSEHGYAMYFNHGDLFIKRFEAKEGGNYPDGGMSFETYTNKLFIEMESLGELTTLAYGESALHTERWSLAKAQLPTITDEAIDEFVKNM